jgi:hypothetical protein
MSHGTNSLLEAPEGPYTIHIPSMRPLAPSEALSGVEWHGWPEILQLNHGFCHFVGGIMLLKPGRCGVVGFFGKVVGRWRAACGYGM